MDRINMNAMANLVAANEQGAEEVDIAQIKEVLKVFMIELGKFDDNLIIQLVERYR
jgi:hypothetical protein